MLEVCVGITILIADMTLDLIFSYHFICEGQHAVLHSFIICKNACFSSSPKSRKHEEKLS